MNSFCQFFNKTRLLAGFVICILPASQAHATLEYSNAVGVTAGVSTSSATSHTNTQVGAGNSLTITSGGNTRLIGALATAQQVTATIGGNLTIQSVQDTSTYSSNQTNKTIGVAEKSLNAGQSNSQTQSNSQSVTQQSGITAGDAGFNVQVQGKTTLIGAAITSTQAGVEGKDANGNPLNTFQSAGGVTFTDIQNSAQYSTKTQSTQLSTDMSLAQAAQSLVAGQLGNMGQSGQAQSTTQSGISGIGGNSTLRTGQNAANALQPIFNAQTVKEQAQLASVFGEQAFRAVGDIASTLKLEEGSTAKIFMHGAAGYMQAKLGGAGATGILGATSAAAFNEAMLPTLVEYVKTQGYTPGSADYNAALKLGSTLLGAATGALAGGGNRNAAAAGGAAALAGTTNNYLKHVEINKLIAANKACSGGGAGSQQACSESKALSELDQKRQQALSDCQGNDSAACNNTRTQAADAMQGLALYKEEIKKLVASGEMSAHAAQSYLNKADVEIKDVATHLKDAYYLKSGGIADPNNADYIKYKVLESMTNGQELGGALTGAPTAGPSEKAVGRVTEPATSRTAGAIDTNPNTRLTADQDLPNVYDNQQQRTVTKVQEEIEALSRIGNNARNDNLNLNSNINRRGEIETIRNAAESVGWKLPDGSPWYPPNGGAIPGTEKTITLPAGAQVDRYGNPNGTYLAPVGTPAPARALPYEPTTEPTKFITTQPIPNVTEGFATPWFNQPGTGRQWQLPTTPNNLPRSIEKK